MMGRKRGGCRRKGAIPVFAAVLIIIIIGAIAISSRVLEGTNLGFFFPGASLLDVSCQPGDVLEPVFQTIKCERNPESLTGVYIPQRQQYGTWPLVSERVFFQCPPAGDAAREGCQVRITTGGSFQIGDYGQIQSGPATVTYDYGDVVDIRLLNAGMYIEARYTTKQLSLYDLTTGIFQRKICDSCDLTCSGMPTDLYNSLPKGQQRYMNVGDSVETVVRWQAYPQPGNYIEWSDSQLGKVPAQCVKQSQNSATILRLEKYSSVSSCYYYRNDVLASVQCCPGDHYLDQTCNGNGRWEAIPEGSDTFGTCVRGGIASTAYCPGGGDWDWADWRPGQPVEKYTCYASTGECVLADRRYDVVCNPLTGSGCPLNQRCNPASWTCTSKPITKMSCVEFGLECCEAGKVADNVEPRSCSEAGYPDNYVCVNGFCQNPLPVNVCDYDGTCQENEVADCPDCQACGIFCQIGNFLWMWLIGCIISTAILIGGAFGLGFLGIPAGKLLTVSPLLTILLIVLVGFALAWLFSVPVATLAAALA